MITEQISAQYLDHMGSDLTVVNAARGSFDKTSSWGPDGKLRQADANLIRFLASGYRTNEWADLLNQIIDASQKHDAKSHLTTILKNFKNKAQHWAPFAHPHLQIRISIPIFLARQFVKHQVGGVWSEVSRRYVSDEPGVWFPNEWHTRPEDIKQGSGDVIDMNEHAWRSEDSMDTYTGINEPWSPEAVVGVALNSYEGMVERGVAPEEARIILPLNMMTTVVWTGSLLFWSRVINQRVDSHAQLAAQELGRKIHAIIESLFPVSIAELTHVSAPQA